MDNPTIRQEASSDKTAIFKVNKAAFERNDEAELADALRVAGDVRFSLVAVREENVIGHVLFSPVTVTANPDSHAVLGLGPVAVLPQHQGKGVGATLIRAGLETCRNAGVAAVVVLGHTDYYPRFGFRPASEHNLRFRGEDMGDSFMVLELIPDTLSHLSGAVHYAPAFD